MLNATLDLTRPDLRRRAVAQLPERIERLCRRGRRLAASGWDVNVMALLIDDAGLLARVCRGLEAEALASRIESLRDAMHVLLADVDPPDARAASEIVRFVDDVAAEQASRIRERRESIDINAAAERDTSDITSMHDATPDDWTLFDAGVDVAENDAESAGALPAEQMEVVAEATPGANPTDPLQVLHVSRGDASADAIDRLLSARGEHVTRHDSAEAALQKADPSVPTLLLLDSEFAAQLAPIEATLRRLRANRRERLVVVALTSQASAADRVHALRIGCDALIELPASAETVVDRLTVHMQILHGEPYRVLIVEDDLSQARLADSILSSAGVQTRVVTSALDTIDEIDVFHPELILMDLYMPDCDGIELTTLIRQRQTNASIAILFVSGEHDASKHMDALKAGGDDFLAKPVQPRQLINAVTSRINRARHHARHSAAPVHMGSRVVDALQLMRRLTELIADTDARAGIGGLIALRTPADGLDHDVLPVVADFVARKLSTRDLVAIDNARGLLVIAEDCASAFLEAYALGLREMIAAERFGSREPSSAILDVGTCAFDAGVVSADGMRAVAIAAITGVDASAIAPLSAGSGGVATPAAVIDASETRVVNDIRLALDGTGFSLLFQPIVSLRGEEEEQFQALLRLQGNSGAVYSAAQIIPVAEHAGLIGTVDRWALDTAVSMLATRAQKGRSARMIVSQSLHGSDNSVDIDALKACLQRYEVDAAALTLDFRAADLIASLPGAEAPFAAMRELGVRLSVAAVDDIEDASALLAAIRFDYLRLGARFANIDAESVRDDLRELVKLAHERSTRVIAPRIEDARGAATMWTLGIDYIQGHFVQRPDASLAFDFQASVM